MIYKFLWAVRYLLLFPFFGRFAFPGYIGPTTFMMGISKAFIGKKVRIFPGLRLEVHGEGEIVVGDNVSIGQDFHITCGKRIDIGEGTVISGGVMVTDIDHQYQDYGVPILEQGHDYFETIIGKNCFIGLGARIQAGTVLGDQCVVGANSVVRGTYGNGSVIVGVPGRVVRKYEAESGSWVKN